MANDRECKTRADAKQGCVVREYHRNGNLKVEIPVKNGKPNGVMRWYYENGTPRLDIEAKGDELISARMS